MRAWRRATVVAGLLMMAAAGCAPPAAPGTTTLPSGATATTTGPTTVATSPPGSGTVGPAAIPDAAMIENLLTDPENFELAQRMSYVTPPRPCAGTRPSDAQLLRGRPAGGLGAPYGTTPLPEGLIEYVAEYRSVEALATYFDELVADVARCPGQIGLAGERGHWQWSIQDSGFAGDQSLLIRIRAQVHYGNISEACCFDNYIAVARQGTILVATTSRGWEASSGTADIAKKWLATGLQRAQSALS